MASAAVLFEEKVQKASLSQTCLYKEGRVCCFLRSGCGLPIPGQREGEAPLRPAHCLASLATSVSALHLPASDGKHAEWPWCDPISAITMLYYKL